MTPLKVAQLTPHLLARIAARAVQMQGCPEAHYGLFEAQQKQAFEKGVYTTIAALESLGFTLIAPATLSPVLPHDREQGRIIIP